MLLGMRFLWCSAGLILHFPESPQQFENKVFSKWLWVWETGESLSGLSNEVRVDGAQWMSGVWPDNCRWGATCEMEHCCGAKCELETAVVQRVSWSTVVVQCVSWSTVVVQHISLVFLTFQVSYCAHHPSDALKALGTTVCSPSDHTVQIHDAQCLFNKKKNTINITLISNQLIHAFFFFFEDPFPIHCNDCILVSISQP